MPESPSYAAAAWLLPPTLLVLAAAAGVLAPRRWRAAGRVTALLALGLLLAASTPVVALALLRTLEPPVLAQPARQGAQAIVVLGGGRNCGAAEWDGVTVNAFTLQRLRYGARLARETGLPVMVTGGRQEGELMGDILQREFRVPVRWIDADSRTTRDNARFASAVLPAAGIERVLLVTDAWHMPRARREFERHGLLPIAAATGYLGQRPFSPYHLVPNAESLRHTQIALREWVGALWYRLTD
ncbi:MAG TPA: YdcF family protein [Burkholderiaceae bacterium]|jgi:uncharacterized SAM-binding protein YcdF (DUF218 family)|nr:YdcF family protein [Burkholderiaceae bacterium]